MFERILFPTDFSAYANAVLNCLPALKNVGLREVILINVIRTGMIALPDTYNLESYKYIYWSIEEQLNTARKTLEKHGLEVKTRLEYGSPAVEVVRVANDEKVNLIIVGAQGTTLAKEIMLGNTALEIIRRSPLPVLVAQAELEHQWSEIIASNECKPILNSVLHPTDFSNCANQAVETIKQMSNVGINEVIVLHVQDERVMKHRTAEQLKEFDLTDQERLEKLCAELSACNLKSRFLLKQGIPFQETLRVADEINPSVIVLGSYGRSAIQEMFLGSTFENVVRQSHYPVLVIKCA